MTGNLDVKQFVQFQKSYFGPVSGDWKLLFTKIKQVHNPKKSVGISMEELKFIYTGFQDYKLLPREDNRENQVDKFRNYLNHHKNDCNIF